MESTQDSRIVRPFGLIGGRYQVDAAGSRLYWISTAIAAVTIILLIASKPLGLSLPATLAIAAAGFVATTALCVAVARNGRKL